MADNRSELAYNKIKEFLLSGVIKPGQKFSAYELSRKLGISRTPITLALKKLEQEKVVDIIPQVGCVFKYPDPQEAREDFLIRAILEGFAAEMATVHANKKEIGELRRIFNNSIACVSSNDRVAYAASNRAFHLKIVQLSQMPRLEELIKNFWATTGYFAASIDFLSQRMELSVQEHGEILRAIEEKEATRARYLVESHLRQCTDAFCKMLLTVKTAPGSNPE
ncbi:FCD domain protein [Neomoorella glycerini]|uniref:FCD domain protein n=1 Tax=Neomoorella glycerini TaxID=55779 RepID=A0A6I5ZTR7_9FIRM|nr:GntR family transcriptional regulator [Moorella glycerini]QGP93146.1 FCD domain protein [Moorella glycerini]